MAAGLYAVFRKRSSSAFILAGSIVALLIPNVFFFHVSRYRLPAAVPFAILAGCGISFMVERARARRYGPVATVILVAVAAGVFFNVWSPRFPGIRSSDYGAQALFYMNRREYAKACSVLEQALRRYPGDVALHRSLAVAFIGLGRDEDAIGELNTVLETDEGDYRSRLARANLLYLAGRYANAACDLEVLLRENANDGLLAKLVECHARAGAIERAKEILENNPGISSLMPPDVLRLIEGH
jgi:tetratricopeptide (TPR) repeat protein